MSLLQGFDGEGTIYETVKSCVDQIEEYITSDRPLSRRYAANMQEKLEVWAKYSGATSRKGISLDDRLEALPSIKHAVLGLLAMIALQIKQAHTLPDQEIGNPEDDAQSVTHERDPGSETRPSSIRSNTRKTEGKILGQQYIIWTAIAKAIDSLFKLAAAIRDGDKSSGDREVPSHYSRPDDSYFEEFAKLLVRRRYPHARKELADQLGRSIHVRRRRILYQQRHEEKLQFQRSAASTDWVKAEMTTLSGHLSALSRESNDPTKDRLSALGIRNHVVAPSLTQFSQFPTQSTIMRRAQAVTVITSRTKGSLISEGEELEYPQPPIGIDQNELVFCPYCCQQLDHSQLRNWRRHVDKDLKALVCISETCQQPLRFFAQSSDWLQHMASYHGHDWPQTVHMMTWFCNIDHEEQQEFRNVDDFREHLDTHKISTSEQDVLVRHNQAIGSRLHGTCPLCEDTLDENAGLEPRRLFDHIAYHLRRIALLALPTADAEPGPDDDGSGFQSDLARKLDSSTDAADSLSRLDFINEGNNDELADKASDELHQGQEELARSNSENVKLRNEFNRQLRWIHLQNPKKGNAYNRQLRWMHLKNQIAKHLSGYQKVTGLSSATKEGKFKCTLGCSWSHTNETDWQEHETMHYPTEIWVCSHEDCQDQAIHKRVSLQRDLARKHHQDHRADDQPIDALLIEQQLNDQHVDVPDSLFPKYCLFRGCSERFESWSDRCHHTGAHLAREDIQDKFHMEESFGHIFSAPKVEVYTESDLDTDSEQPPSSPVRALWVDDDADDHDNKASLSSFDNWINESWNLDEQFNNPSASTLMGIHKDASLPEGVQSAGELGATSLTSLVLAPHDRNRMKLKIIQQPQAARACGLGERDRWVIDPPPILQLYLEEYNPESVSDREILKSPFNMVSCSLIAGDASSAGADVSMIFDPDDPSRKMRRLMGQLVIIPFITEDLSANEEIPKEASIGAYYIFSDLSCRQNGRFKLRFSLLPFDVSAGPIGGRTDIAAFIESDEFTVYSAKDFPGMQISSELARRLKSLGANLSIKKGNKGRQRSKEKKRASDSDSGSGSTVVQDSLTKRRVNMLNTEAARKSRPRGKKFAYQNPSDHNDLDTGE